MKQIQNLTFASIDRTTPEGKLLSTAICVIGALRFKDKKPEHVLELIKEIALFPFVSESLDETMAKIIEKHQTKNN